jgi:hypothetical protein
MKFPVELADELSQDFQEDGGRLLAHLAEFAAFARVHPRWPLEEAVLRRSRGAVEPEAGLGMSPGRWRSRMFLVRRSR